jgi:hypothetical protein
MARHPSPSLAALSIVHGVLFLTGLVVTTVVAGSHFPSPFGGATTWFALHPNAVLASAFFTFGSAIPLGIYAATASSRLRFLGVEAAGGTIAAFGGFGASFFLALSGLLQWTMSYEPLRALHLLAFATGGIGAVVMLGLLVAGIAVTAGLHRLVPRTAMWVGLAIAIVAELSTLAILSEPLAVFLPIARFAAMVWLVVVGFMLPKSRESRRSSALRHAEGAA